MEPIEPHRHERFACAEGAQKNLELGVLLRYSFPDTIAGKIERQYYKDPISTTLWC